MIFQFQAILFNRLRAKTPIDTGNMLANIVFGMESQNKATISIAAPMRTRSGLSRRTGKMVNPSDSDSDCAKDVNYSSKSPHRFWVERQIVETRNIVISNFNYGLY